MTPTQTVPHLGREVYRARVASCVVPTKSLLPSELQFVVYDLEEDDPIVHRLSHDPLLRRRLGHRGQRVQTGVLDQLRIDGNPPEAREHYRLLPTDLATQPSRPTHHSQILSDLSSDVVQKRRFLSKKVIVLTGPRWRSYSYKRVGK